MMVRYYSEHPLTGTALAVIREAKENVFGNRPIDFAEVQTPGPGVLCFGKGHPGAVETLTIPQVTTAPFAVSALTEAFMLIKNPRVSLPPKADINPDPWWDFDTVLAYDIENAPDGSLLTVAVTDGRRIGVWTQDFEHVARALAPCYYLIGHGMKYDTKVIERNTGTTLAQFFDTMIARYTLHPASQGHLDLKSVARRVLGAPEWEADLKKYTGSGDNADYSKIPLPRLVEYNAADAWYTFLLYLHLKPLVEHNPAFWFTMRTTWTISHIERVGIAIDLEHVKNLSDELEAEAAEHRANLPMDNPGSWMQVLKALGEAGVPVEFKPKGMSTPQWTSRKKMLARQGIVTGTDEKTLSKLTHIEFVPHLLAWRKATKLRSTYCESYLAKHEDGILFPTYNAHGTSTGRLSSSLPNFQNVPRDPRLRSIFVSRNRENGLFVSADYKNAELRTMAMLSGDEAMQALFQPGMPDYFDSTIPVAFPEFTYEDYLALKESDPDEAKEMRTLLKTVIFGLSYNRQAPAIAEALGVSVEYAQSVIDNYLNGFPKLKAWRARVQEAALDPDQRDFLTTPFGKRFESEVVTDNNRQSVINAALAFLPQSTASDICVDAASRILPQLPDGVFLVGLVHDMHGYDVTDPDKLPELVALLEREMPAAGARVFGDAVPFMVDIEVGRSWGEHD